jgi:hypothetical protein
MKQNSSLLNQRLFSLYIPCAHILIVLVLKFILLGSRLKRLETGLIMNNFQQ